MFLNNGQQAAFTTITNGVVNNGWTLNVSGQTISVTAANGMIGSYYGGKVRLELVVKLKNGEATDLSKYYVSSGSTIRSEIPNMASTVFTWAHGTPASVTKNTGVVKVRVEEQLEQVELKKVNDANTVVNTIANPDIIPDAVFMVQQWNGSSYVDFCRMTYNPARGIYISDAYLNRTTANAGKFRIVETGTPAGYVGSFMKEFTITGTAGALEVLQLTAVNQMATGKIHILKQGTDGKNLAGARYEIHASKDVLTPEGTVLYKAGTLIDTVTTGADGTVDSKPLRPGEYKVTETLPPAGYVLTSEEQTVTITYIDKNQGASTVNVIFKNPPTLVYLQKLSERADGETTDTVLAGVSFKVWNKGSGSEGTADTYTTDDAGKIRLEGFVPGTYCYKEVVSTVIPGYVPDTVTHEFVIDNNGFCEMEQGHVINVVNKFIKAEFAKTDKATGTLIAGAQMEFTDSQGNVIESWTSTTAPHRINRIPAGTYTLTETAAPSGYKKGKPMQVVIRNDTDAVQDYTFTNVRYVNIVLTKTIHTDEIVWAHGNPTFTFKVTGTDLDGDVFEMYDTVEFKKETTASAVSASLQTTITVPAGRYSALELDTVRYELEGITGIRNGSLSGNAVGFDLSQNLDGAATFINKKVADGNLSDTVFVRNTMKK